MIHVLVIDDSAVVRQMMTGIVGSAPDMRVSSAADPIIAMLKMKTAKPDVIVLDLEMPRMDGMTFLRTLMATDPLPVVVCSGRAGSGTAAAVAALEEGAVEVIGKPSIGVGDFLAEQRAMILQSIRGAAAARVVSTASQASTIEEPRPPRVLSARMSPNSVVAIGASTGGTEALRGVLSRMPVDAPPIVVVQHMPAPFTRAFAARMDQQCAIEVKEAEDGDEIRSGRALIAPGDHHLVVQKTPRGYAARLSDEPPVSRHRPSVDVLFRSVARAAGRNGVGVIMTGMGEDGAAGLLEMRLTGAATIAQDERTCVVFGMPREAIQRGAAASVTPLHRIAREILSAVN